MRAAKALVCVAVAAQASSFEEDDDFSFIRSLSSNASNATTTTTTTTTVVNTTTTTTTTTTVGNTTTTTTTTTPEGNATTTTTTLKPQGTSGGTEGGSSAPVKTQAPITKNTTVTDNSTAPVEDTVVEIMTETQMVPLVAVPTSVPTSRLRRLAGHVNKAYNLFCSSFSMTSAMVACQALQGAGQIPADGTAAAAGIASYQAGTVLFPSMEYCVVNIDMPVANTHCADTSTSSLGHCIKNDASTGMSKHTGCTKHEAIAGSSAYKYKTKLSFQIPAAEATSAAADIQTAKVAADTAASSTATKDLLKSMIVVAAVKMSEDPAVAAAVNFTESFGLSTTALAAVKTAIDAGSVLSVVAAPPAALTTATTSMAQTVDFSAVTSVSTTNAGAGGSTSGAPTIMAGSAVAVALLSLVF